MTTGNHVRSACHCGYFELGISKFLLSNSVLSLQKLHTNGYHPTNNKWLLKITKKCSYT